MDIHAVRQQLRSKSIYDIPMRVTYYARVSSESDEPIFVKNLENVQGDETDILTKGFPAFLPKSVRTLTVCWRRPQRIGST